MTEDPANALDRRRWPAGLPPVKQLLEQSLDLAPATILVGENGSGKSKNPSMHGDLPFHGKSQVIMSTHSPLLAALPGAQILEAGQWGLRPRKWDDLDLITNWRSFLDAPERYLQHL
ncbi:hypothetical protein [Paenarthrobacter nitroguajacolicus]|uniref:hypothetical protein n=1 Tax=Paenarthrobacter nitroguajacolicus TaxID=211146 RepID=UPI00285CEA2E|nr:hypothetical protein [Paenarthrobacter nitroguajacolicus]MDR6637685.1 putative ATPase [Paenarthrobacter nitroguajacolicus]